MIETENDILDQGVKAGRPKGARDSYPRPSRPDMAWSGNAEMQPGDNRKYLRHALLSANLPPIDIADGGQVEERVSWYFNQCGKDDIKPTVSGLCNALGISRRTFYGWGAGEHRSRTHQEIVERARRVLEELWEDYMVHGKINPVVGIFLGKNHFGYADKSEVVLAPKTGPYEDPTPAEELERKYLLDAAIDEY